MFKPPKKIMKWQKEIKKFKELQVRRANIIVKFMKTTIWSYGFIRKSGNLFSISGGRDVLTFQMC